jgi:hypothetical protein
MCMYALSTMCARFSPWEPVFSWSEFAANRYACHPCTCTILTNLLARMYMLQTLPDPKLNVNVHTRGTPGTHHDVVYSNKKNYYAKMFCCPCGGNVHNPILETFISRASYLNFLTKKAGQLIIQKILNWYILTQLYCKISTWKWKYIIMCTHVIFGS